MFLYLCRYRCGTKICFAFLFSLSVLLFYQKRAIPKREKIMLKIISEQIQMRYFRLWLYLKGNNCPFSAYPFPDGFWVPKGFAKECEYNWIMIVSAIHSTSVLCVAEIFIYRKEKWAISVTKIVWDFALWF